MKNSGNDQKLITEEKARVEFKSATSSNVDSVINSESYLPARSFFQESKCNKHVANELPMSASPKKSTLSIADTLSQNSTSTLWNRDINSNSANLSKTRHSNFSKKSTSITSKSSKSAYSSSKKKGKGWKDKKDIPQITKYFPKSQNTEHYSKGSK